MYICLYVKYSLLSDFNNIRIFLTDFRKYSNFIKSAQWEPSCSMRMERQRLTEMIKLLATSHNFKNAPKIRYLRSSGKFPDCISSEGRRFYYTWKIESCSTARLLSLRSRVRNFFRDVRARGSIICSPLPARYNSSNSWSSANVWPVTWLSLLVSGASQSHVLRHSKAQHFFEDNYIDLTVYLLLSDCITSTHYKFMNFVQNY